MKIRPNTSTLKGQIKEIYSYTLTTFPLRKFVTMYFGSLLNDSNLRQPEISERICKGNRAYYAHAKLLRLKFLKRNIKMKIYLNLIRPVDLRASQTWNFTKIKMGSVYVKGSS
jgi:hypothetical protein